MDTTSPLVLSLVFGAAAAAANVIGGLVVVARRHWNEMFLKYFIGLGAGFMLAATFLRMLPTSLSLSPHAPLLILVGYFLVQFFEHTLAPHFHFGEEHHKDAMVNPAVGFSALLGLSIHTFFDGVSIASGFLLSVPLGMLIFFAVVLHKIPEGVTVASIALASGQGKKAALTASFVLAGATLAGVLSMNRFSGVVAYALPLSTGVTLYVAASDLIPQVNEERGLRMPLVVFLGVALFYVTEHILDAFTA
ncbi:MAG TPA: ZIP family metal transporter [Vicinamibacteria bacterium]|nr:ZIP family metal transporter [Vicinamibacteria bacterium]